MKQEKLQLFTIPLDHPKDKHYKMKNDVDCVDFAKLERVLDKR